MLFEPVYMTGSARGFGRIWNAARMLAQPRGRAWSAADAHALALDGHGGLAYRRVSK